MLLMNIGHEACHALRAFIYFFKVEIKLRETKH